MPYSPFTTFKASMDLSDGTCRYIRQPGSRPGRFIQHHYDAGICINSFYFYFSLSAMQTWNSLLNRSTVFTDGVKSRLFHFRTGAVIVWIHFMICPFQVSDYRLEFLCLPKKIRLAVWEILTQPIILAEQNRGGSPGLWPWCRRFVCYQITKPNEKATVLTVGWKRNKPVIK